jgi:hypothetical protein
MAKPASRIKDLGYDLDGQGDNKANDIVQNGENVNETQENVQNSQGDDKANNIVQNGEDVNETPSARKKEPKEKKPQAGKAKPTKKGDGKGITPQSPTVYLLPEEKSFIKKLEAHILLKTGKSVNDHQLIMDAIREYVKKHHSDFIVIAS